MSGKALNTSSGDLLADRRADYAAMLAQEAEWAGAAEVMLGALEIAPSWAFGWFRLGEMHDGGGNKAAAVEAWRMAQTLDPADHAGASLKLALAGSAPTPEHPPSAFVETLFDQYAQRFDQTLVGVLAYRAPALLFEAIRRTESGHFSNVVDLGCGTGLMGERMRPVTAMLAGFDISAAMLAKARTKGIYDRLEKGDLQHLPFAGEPADLIVAADVFMYLGRLDTAFPGIAAMVVKGGLFAFSVEKLEGEGFALRETRRYAHSEAYVRDMLVGAGFEIAVLEQAVIRHDRNLPVQGLIAVARLN